MALNRITLKNAQEIVDIYSSLMENKGEEDYSYSKMLGYDIYDIDNSIKLLIAYYVFTTPILDDERLKRLKEFASWGQNGVTLFFMSFVPDYVYKEISQYKYLSPEYLHKKNKLTADGNYLSKDFHVFLERKLETMDSYLEYCIKIGKNDPEYWPKIYSRLDLIFVPKDEIIDTAKNSFL